MIHIVFNEPDIEVLQKALDMDVALQGEIMIVRDDYAVGPLGDIYSAEGMAARRQWWKEVLAGGDYAGSAEDGSVDDAALVENLKKRLDEFSEEVVWIWAAQNKHDVCGYYWLISQMNDYQGRVFILYLNNLPFINEKGQIFYPEWISQIQPREFLKAKKLARPVTTSEFEVDADEWKKICGEDKGVRLLEGGKKIVQEGYDYYDADLRKYVSGDWQKASRVIHHFLSRNKQTTGDAYLLWRIKQLGSAGLWDIQGELKGMKDFEIKTKEAVGLSASVATEPENL
jgi:hypothetical protein